MIRLGIIGTGGMANAHAAEFQQIKGVRITCCCDVSPERARTFAAKHRIPGIYADYREMLERERLDAVSNVTPDAMHAEISLAAIDKGLAILCEKPMAATLEDARKMARAAEEAGVINMVNFSYRNASALQHAAAAVRKGQIGRVIHVEASYLQSWLVSPAWGRWQDSPAFTWRLSTKHGSGGALGDIGCHIYDMTCLLCGDIAEIDCRLKTFDKGLPGNVMGEFVLDANDSFVSTVVFANGALGAVHASRWAVGQENSLRVRAYGDQGAIEVDLDKSYTAYRICSGRRHIETSTWETVICKPTPSTYRRFIRAIKTGQNDASDFANGRKIQAYLHYSNMSSERRQPVMVEG